MEQYPSMMLTFDWSTRPWKMNVIQRPQIPTAEGRLTRNVKSATVIRDDSELVTRAWIEGYKKKGQYGSYTNDAAVAKYGLIEQVISGANDKPSIAKKTAKTFVKNHKDPKITVTIDGIDLSQITGENMDRFNIGKLMRLSLPDYGETVTETVTGLSFPSIYKNPNACTVTLNKEEDKVIKYIKKAQDSARKASRSAARISSTAIVNASVANNTLTLTYGNGDTVNFSKAVTLTGGWGSGTYTVKAYQKNGKNSTLVASIATVLNGIALQDNEEPSAEGKNLKLPLKVTYKNGNATSNTGYKNTITVAADSVYNAGALSVILTDPSWLNPPSASPSGNSNTVSVSTNGRTPKLTKSVKLYLVRGDWSSGQREVYLNQTDSTAENRVAHISIDARLLTPTWTNEPSTAPSSNSNTVTVSSMTGQSKSVALYLVRGDWSNGKRYVYINQTDSTAENRVARTEIDARLNDPSWATTPSSSISGNSNTVTVSSMTGESKSVKLYMNSGSWSNGSKYVYVTHTDSAEGHRVARTSVSIPDPTDLSHITTYGNTAPSGAFSFYTLSKSGITAGKYMSMTAKYGGKTFTFYFQVVA